MKQDLDRLMAERQLDALLVLGNSGGNPVMNYLTNGAHLERALVVKRRGGPLTLIHGGMERDTAAATGLHLVDRDTRYNMMSYLQAHEGNRLAAQVDYLSDIVRDEALRGRLGVYGMMDAGEALAMLNLLQDRVDGAEIVGEYGDSLFALARETKDDAEIALMAEAGRITAQVVGDTQEFVRGHAVRGDRIVKPDSEPLTIGDVKAFIRSRIYALGMEEDHGTIFAQGRDAGGLAVGGEADGQGVEGAFDAHEFGSGRNGVGVFVEAEQGCALVEGSGGGGVEVFRHPRVCVRGGAADETDEFAFGVVEAE